MMEAGHPGRRSPRPGPAGGGVRQDWSRGRGRLVAVAVLGTAALVVTAVLAGPWALAVWAGGIVVAVGTDVVKGALQRRVEGVLTPAPDSPLTVTVRLDVGNYVHVADDAGTRLVPLSGHSVDITVETSGAQAVILRRLVPVVVSHTPIPDARRVPHLGGLPVRRMHVWLSERPPRLSVDGETGFPYKVTAGDPEVFSLIAHVTEGCTRWHLDLVWSCNGRDGVHRVDIDGQPFQTAGGEGLGETGV